MRALCCADDVVPPWAVGLCDRSPIGPLPGGDADKVPARIIENADAIMVTVLFVFMGYVLSFFGLSAPRRKISDGTKGRREGHW